MLHIAICDDEQTTVAQVEKAVQYFFKTHCIETKVQTYQSGENLQYDLMDGRGKYSYARGTADHDQQSRASRF